MYRFQDSEEGLYQGSYLSPVTQDVYISIKEKSDRDDQYGVRYSLTQNSIQYEPCENDERGGTQEEPEMLNAGMYALSVCGEEWYVFESTENLQVGITIDYATSDGVLQAKFFSEGVLLQESEENSVYFNHRSSHGEGSEEILHQHQRGCGLGISITWCTEESPVVRLSPTISLLSP